MADKTSYKEAHKQRKGTATMTIEAAPSYVDKEIPSPDSERFPKPGVSPEPNATGEDKMRTVPVHPGEYGLSALHSDVTKT